MRQRILVLVLSVVAVLGSASSWIYIAAQDRNKFNVPQSEQASLQQSFASQYGTDAVIKQAIIPRIYEIVWVDPQGNTNVSLDIGGVWILIATQGDK